MSEVNPLERVAVVGLGLIGGSLARGLVSAGVRVVGWDTHSGTRRAAAVAGVPVADSLEDCVKDLPDLIILAVPLTAMAATCAAIEPFVAGHTLVTDVGSVKSPVRRVIESTSLASRYVGSHPMAGTEKTGFNASSAALFHDAAWVVTLGNAAAESNRSIPTALAVIELVTRALGCRVYVMTDEAHDESVALISHLPHVFAAQLLNQTRESPLREIALAIAAGSFRDGTRVAGTNPARTEAMITGNRGWVAPLVENAANQLHALAEQLRVGGDVGAFFDRATSGRGVLEPETSGATHTQAVLVHYRTMDPSAVRDRMLQSTKDGLHVHRIDASNDTIEYRR